MIKYEINSQYKLNVAVMKRFFEMPTGRMFPSIPSSGEKILIRNEIVSMTGDSSSFQ